MTNALLEAATNYISRTPSEHELYRFPFGPGGLMTATEARMPRHMVFRPSLCVVVQGAKRLTLDGKAFDYAANQALVVSLELPAVGHVTVASEAQPYIGAIIDLDPAILEQVLEAMPNPPRSSDGGVGLFVADVDESLRECMTRLIRLSPDAAPVLYPAVLREIAYWLLSGPHGGEIAKLARPDGQARRIGAAINLLRENFDKPLPIEQLADAARMSPSSFYQHFKSLTAMTPLQYQKQLRLTEARRRMLAEAANVETAAFSVGYESASQFSREYSRLFGAPPKRDVTARRASFAAESLAPELG